MDLQRQRKIFDPSKFEPRTVWIIGCGNIGSNVAVALVRLGVENIVLFDGDDVETVNLSTQHYLPKHLGLYKVDALQEQLLEINSEGKFSVVNNYIDDVSGLRNVMHPDIIVAGLDSLEARRTVRDAIREYRYVNKVPIIDGRMGKQQVEVHVFNNAEEWQIPGDDDNIMEADCTEKFIVYTPLMCAALIADTVKKIISEEKPVKSHIYDFKTNVMCVDRS